LPGGKGHQKSHGTVYFLPSSRASRCSKRSKGLDTGLLLAPLLILPDSPPFARSLLPQNGSTLS